MAVRIRYAYQLSVMRTERMRPRIFEETAVCQAAPAPIGARKKPGAARFARVGLSLYFVFFMRAFAAILFFMVQPLCSMAAPTKPENSGCGRFGRDLNSG